MQTIERTAKTVEEAVEGALTELNLRREQVEVEVIEEATKGILGLLSRPARVRVKIKETTAARMKLLLREILAAMDLSADIDINEDEQVICANLHGADLGVLIGRHGETLDSLQYLLSLAINRDQEKRKKVLVDVEDYRSRREEALVALAKKLADRARQRRRSVVLEPMNAMERRIIHMTLQGEEDIYTFSEGVEPFRKIIISPRGRKPATTI